MIDTERLNRVVKANLETLYRGVFLEGKRVRGEWKVADISGAPGNSLGIQLTGQKAGLWHDRATGEGGGFIKLIQLSRGLTFLEAVDLIERVVGVDLKLSEDAARRLGRENRRPLLVGRTNRGQNSHKKVWDWRAALRNGTEGELETLAENRNISTEGVRIAQERGLLRFIDSLEGVAWVITDRCLTQAIWRRLDGKVWKNGAKAKLLRGVPGSARLGFRRPNRSEQSPWSKEGRTRYQFLAMRTAIPAKALSALSACQAAIRTLKKRISGSWLGRLSEYFHTKIGQE